VQFYCERFGKSLYDADEEMIWRAYMIKELVMVRDGVCCLSSDEFFRDDVLALIFNLSVS